ncbi:MAG: hypothetical protein L3J91_02885, partial [Thermoplasmata archaeon]|nr:hypothetical protein [Thermoplasmata archaeon]
VVYFAIRLIGRAQIAKPIRAMGPGTVPVPTTNPLSWIVLREERAQGRVTTTYLRYRLGRGIVMGPFRVSARTDASPDDVGPVGSEAEALERSYPVARRHSRLLDDTYHFGEAQRAAGGAWVVVWFSLEFTALGRAAATRVTIGGDGAMSARRAWYRPKWSGVPV